MAVFMDHRAQCPYPGQMTDIQWHKTSPILAVASQSESGTGMVNFYLEEGEHLQDCIIKKSRPASVLCWHPSKRAIAIGWETGELCVWNEHDRETFEVQTVHKGEISIILWSSNGSKLLTGDTTGILALWKADTRGRLQQIPIVSHTLGEAFTQAVLRPTGPVDPANDIASLARAAVSGDENALDMFAWKGKDNNMKVINSSIGGAEATCFYIGGQNGSVYYLNDAGHVQHQFTAESAVRKLLYYDDKNILITVTNANMLTQHAVSMEGDLRELLIVKLSGKPENADMIWAGKGILATCTGEPVIRMWDIDREENFILNLDAHSSYERTENINCLSFSCKKNILAAGTSHGNIALFKYFPYYSSSKPLEPEDLWKLQPPCSVAGPISDVTWGSSKNLLAVNTVDNVFILNEQIMSAHYCDETVVVQTGPMSLSVDAFASLQHHDLKADIQIKGVATTRDNIVMWDGKKVVVYEITSDASHIRAAGTFTSSTQLGAIYEQSVFTVEVGERNISKVEVRNFQGTVKQLLQFSDSEGIPTYMTVCSQYLIIATSNGFLKLFDLGRSREAKQMANPKNIAEAVPDISAIVSAKCNCNGSKVSIIISKANGEPDPHLYIWDVEMDNVQFFNFETGHGEQDEYMLEQSSQDQELSNEERGKHQAAKDIQGRYPHSHFWDKTEPKLLVCEAKALSTSKPLSAQQQQQQQQQMLPTEMTLMKQVMHVEVVENMIVSLFVTPEHGIVIQDSFGIQKQHSTLLGLQVPFFYFSKKLDLTADEQEEDEELPTDMSMKVPSVKNVPAAHSFTSAGASATVIEEKKAEVVPQPPKHRYSSTRKVMRDFVGLERAEQSARDAMMNFSYFLTIGNMDEAFKAIKLVKTESVWENMARMCVKTRRLDVATVCLGNMSHARGAKQLREASSTEEQLDTKVAILAMQLGQNEDAERLLKNSKRYDLLNNFYQASGLWTKAIETAELYDRIHLRSTYYNYAKHLEIKGDISSAIPNYEKSDTHRFEVPRMLYTDPQALVAYISKNKDKALNKWYAQFMESNGEQETALRYYEAAGDCLQRVRVHCYCGNLEQAAEICNSTGDKAACYHLAREYENKEMSNEAVHFYTRAGAYGNAIRLSREGGNDDQLMNLALLGKPEDMVEAARTYEFQPKNQDKAVMLYHKAGYFSKALDLAFNTKQFAALQLISEDLDESTDPELVARCADFFIENSQFDRAVDLLAVAKKYWDALKICMEQHVDMTENLVEKLTPVKGEMETPGEEEERNKILEGIAEVCMQQRQYHLATKKYTQSGNKLKAMKALLKSGDTEKIVFFAGVSRQKEIYILAANYLQSLDWRRDPNIMKNIIGFYTKGRALDSLSSFYDACAQVEIDEYQNYEKALGALSEALKCLQKGRNMDEQSERVIDLSTRIEHIKKFVQAKRVYEEDAEEAIKLVQNLMEVANIDNAVRLGDMYGFLVEHFAKKDKMKAAWNCMEEMRTRMPKVNLTYYISMPTLEAVHKALDRPMNDILGAQDDAGDDDIDEDVVEDTTLHF